MYFIKKYLLLAVCAAGFFGRADGGTMSGIVPESVTNFEMPYFDDSTGRKEWIVKSAKALYVDAEQYDLDDVELELFESNPASRKNTLIKSSNASVNPNTRIVKSREKLFVSGDGFSVVGKEWSWDAQKKFLSIKSGVGIEIVPPKSGSGKAADGLNAPVKITGDKGTLSHGGNENIFYVGGKVVSQSEDFSVNCGNLRANASRDGDRALREIEAWENVDMLHSGRRGTAEHAKIFPRTGEAVMSGNPHITEIKSGAEVSGSTIELKKTDRLAVATSSGAVRATAVVPQKSDDGKIRKIRVSSDTITMREQKGLRNFDFTRDVSVKYDDFTASCDFMRARETVSADGVAAITSITGEGSVKASGRDGTATAKRFEADPTKSELSLMQSVKLCDTSRGFSIDANHIAFNQKSGDAIAVSDKKNPADFVVCVMDESVKSSADSNPRGMTVVKSRVANVRRVEPNKSQMQFITDVSLFSGDIAAVCSALKVFADNTGGSTRIDKAEARDGVEVKFNDMVSKSELANIYPRPTSLAKSQTHVDAELLTDESQKRPEVTLPYSGAFGFADDSKSTAGSAPKMLNIQSAKQWIVSDAAGYIIYFKGNVKIKGADINGDCDEIQVKIARAKTLGKERVSYLVLTGNVSLVTPEWDISCGRAEMFVAENKAVLTRDPVVRQLQTNRRLTGEKIILTRGETDVVVESSANEKPTVLLPPLDELLEKK